MRLLQRLLGAIIGIVLLVAAFFVASLLLAVVAVVALLLWGWLSWRTRNLPRTRGAQGAAKQAPDGQVIEGEYRVEREIRRIDDDAR